MIKNKYIIYSDDSKNGISVEKYILNKEVFCIKMISDIDLIEIISEYSTILVTYVVCEQVREDCHYFEIKFKDFSGKEKSCKVFIDGGEYALSSFVKSNFLPIQNIVKMKDIINSLPNLKDWDFNIGLGSNDSSYNYNDVEKRSYCRGYRDCFNYIHEKVNGDKAF